MISCCPTRITVPAGICRNTPVSGPIVREFYSGKERVVVVFEGLTAAERATIKAHRAAHSLLAFDFDWDGTILSCVYGPSALKWKPEKPDRWGLRMELVVV